MPPVKSTSRLKLPAPVRPPFRWHRAAHPDGDGRQVGGTTRPASELHPGLLGRGLKPRGQPLTHTQLAPSARLERASQRFKGADPALDHEGQFRRGDRRGSNPHRRVHRAPCRATTPRPPHVPGPGFEPGGSCAPSWSRTTPSGSSGQRSSPRELPGRKAGLASRRHVFLFNCQRARAARPPRWVSGDSNPVRSGKNRVLGHQSF